MSSPKKRTIEERVERWEKRMALLTALKIPILEQNISAAQDTISGLLGATLERNARAREREARVDKELRLLKAAAIKLGVPVVEITVPSDEEPSESSDDESYQPSEEEEEEEERPKRVKETKE